MSKLIPIVNSATLKHFVPDFPVKLVDLDDEHTVPTAPLKAVVEIDLLSASAYLPQIARGEQNEIDTIGKAEIKSLIFQLPTKQFVRLMIPAHEITPAALASDIAVDAPPEARVDIEGKPVETDLSQLLVKIDASLDRTTSLLKTDIKLLSPAVEGQEAALTLVGFEGEFERVHVAKEVVREGFADSIVESLKDQPIVDVEQPTVPEPRPTVEAEPNPVVRLSLGKHGVVDLELFPKEAPETVANFLDYVNSGYYDGLVFHRVIPGFMIQGGGFEPGMVQKKPTFESIQNEATNGLKNEKYTLAMARTSAPHSAQSQFFINVVDNTFLDHTQRTSQGWGYAVFGRVIAGEKFVDEIAKVETGRRGFHDDVPKQDVVIETAQLLKSEPDEAAAS